MVRGIIDGRRRASMNGRATHTIPAGEIKHKTRLTDTLIEAC
jgi:hypothetical protein